MTRSRARVFWLVLLVLLGAGLLGLYQVFSHTALSIQQQKSALVASQQELENTSRLSVALDELDRLTINENTATRLDILRHMGLENNDYDVSIGSRLVKAVGHIQLMTRQVRITVNLPYVQALGLADKLYNNRKINLTGVTLTNANPRYPGAEVEMTVTGMLYGINKREAP